MDKAILRRLRQIDIQTRHVVQDSFAGAYHSAFKGRGMIFDAVRPYEPGDDIRSIDWNVTARAGAAYVKRFIEERELTVMLALDVSGSLGIGSQGRLKRELAAELGAVLAYSAAKNHDRVSLVLFSDQIEQYVPARKGRNHVLRIVRDLLVAEGRSRGTNLAEGLRHINQALRRRAIIFFISDFLDDTTAYQHELAMLAKRHDVVAVMIRDPLEEAWPALGFQAVLDAESGAVAFVDSTSAGRAAYAAVMAQRWSATCTLLARAGVDYIVLDTAQDYLPALQAFFKRRERRG